MKVTVFEKQAQAKDGRKFKVYSAKLARKDGTEQYVTVKFRKELQLPAEFPAIINVSKQDANLSRKEWTADDGETGYRFTLWITNYTATGEKFVDHSLDDFAD